MNYFYCNQPQQSETIFAYVNGISDAKNFQLSANKSALLMDNEKDIFYLKTVNSLGQSSIKCYEFKEIEEPKPISFATKAEIEELHTKMNDLINMIKESKNG